MFTLLVTIHVMVSICLIIVVLLQTGKGAEMGAAFGGASQTIFGSRGAMDFMEKMTTGAAILFMVTSLTLALYSSRRSSVPVALPIQEETLPSPVTNTEGQQLPAPVTGSGEEVPPLQ